MLQPIFNPIVDYMLKGIYDDSSSLLEFVAKLHSKLNEVVDEVNLKLPDNFETAFYEKFREYTREEMQRIIDSGEFLEILEQILINVSELENMMDSKVNDLSETVSEKINLINAVSPGLNDSAKLKGMIPFRTYVQTERYAGLQGVAVVNDKLYVTMNAAASENQIIGLLMEFDYNTLELIRSVELPIYHANSIAYNPDRNGVPVLVIPHTQKDTTDPNRVSIVNLTTFALIEDISLPEYVYTIAYDLVHKYYVGFGADFIYTFDENFDLVDTIPNPNIPGTLQANSVYNDTWITLRANTNKLSLITSEGKLFRTYEIDNRMGHLESCSPIGDGKFLLAFNTVVNGVAMISLYTIDLLASTGSIRTANSDLISPITGDLITEVHKLVARGVMSGKILFLEGSTNLPPSYTVAYVTFNAWLGSNKIYLEAINFTTTASIMYVGQISGSAIVWRSIPLTDPNQPIP